VLHLLGLTSSLPSRMPQNVLFVCVVLACPCGAWDVAWAWIHRAEGRGSLFGPLSKTTSGPSSHSPGVSVTCSLLLKSLTLLQHLRSNFMQGQYCNSPYTVTETP